MTPADRFTMPTTLDEWRAVQTIAKDYDLRTSAQRTVWDKEDRESLLAAASRLLERQRVLDIVEAEIERWRRVGATAVSETIAVEALRDVRAAIIADQNQPTLDSEGGAM